MINLKNLENIGFLESEAKVYLSLLKNKRLSVTDLAKDTKLNRISVYNAISKLISKGLVSSIIKSSNKEYKLNDPNSLLNLIEDKKKELNKVEKEIPSLKNILGSNDEGVEISVYEGVNGAKSVWESVLKESKKGDEWLIQGASKNAEIFGGYFKEFNDRRSKKGLKLKIIYNKDAIDLAEVRKRQPLTQVRMMSKEYMTPASLEVINDNALIVLYSPKIVVFHIKNKEVAKSYGAYFEMLWKIGKN